MNGGVRADPKAPLIVELWKQYAGQIESDLLGLGLDLADWHQDTRDERGRPKLSSRRLAVVLEHLSDESAFKTALRGGRQSRATRVIEETLNEAMRLRASYETVASQGQVQWDPADYAWLDPKDEIERAERLAAEEAEREAADDTFFSELGFT